MERTGHISSGIDLEGSVFTPEQRYSEPQSDDDILRHPDFRLNTADGAIVFNDQSVLVLAKTEAKCFKFFMQNPNQLLDNKEIKMGVYGRDDLGDFAVRALVLRIRSRLEGKNIIGVLVNFQRRSYRLNNSLEPESTDDIRVHSMFRFNKRTGEMEVASQQQLLTKSEVEILLHLFNNMDTITTNEALRRLITDVDLGKQGCQDLDKLIRTRIYRIRKKISAGRDVESPIRTIRAVGYSLVNETQPQGHALEAKSGS